MRAGCGVQTLAPEIKTVGNNAKPVLPRHLRLKCFYLLILELEDVATRSADQVVVMFLTHFGRFIPRLAIPELPLLGDPRIHEQLHRSIHRRVAKAWDRLLYKNENLVEREMDTAREERLDNGVALPSALQPLPAHVRGQPLSKELYIRHPRTSRRRTT